MNRFAKTIQHFLPTGDPRGIRIAEITTRIVQVIEVPRSLLQDFLGMPESGQVAVYFLFGQSDDSAESRVYIGQTGDLRARLASHNKSKDFWQRAFVLVSRTNSLTQTHALFLEWHCLRVAQEVGRYTVENGNSGSKPHTPAPLEADCLEIFETGQVLLTTLGCPIFEAVARIEGSAAEAEVFYCRANGSDARGQYTPEGFVVLKGSSGRRKSVPHLEGTSSGRFREKLVESGVMKESGQKVVFPKDHLFGSPSMAAIALLGRVSNGWIEWKTEDGRTLDEVKRKGEQ
jgi:predicted GIY-YIG superfamily endonuclease